MRKIVVSVVLGIVALVAAAEGGDAKGPNPTDVQPLGGERELLGAHGLILDGRARLSMAQRDVIRCPCLTPAAVESV